MGSTVITAIDYSRAPCLGADQKVSGLWERDWSVLVLTKRHVGSGNELARSSLDNNIVRMRLDQQPIDQPIVC